MNAWMEMVRRIELREGIDPVVAAAITAFGFVFIHPFDDANGRIHRFLVHHILAKLGFTPPGILFPVSAAMLRNRRAYDQVLERFSDSILPFLRYDLDLEHGMVVHNDTARLYRYFDATAQAEYLYQCIDETIHRDLRDEIGFLTVFDTALRAVFNIVNMPNRRAALLVRFILQNKSRLSKGKRAPNRKLGVANRDLSRLQQITEDDHPPSCSMPLVKVCWYRKASHYAGRTKTSSGRIAQLFCRWGTLSECLRAWIVCPLCILG
jgi:hypothetical protein